MTSYQRRLKTTNATTAAAATNSSSKLPTATPETCLISEDDGLEICDTAATATDADTSKLAATIQLMLHGVMM